MPLFPSHGQTVKDTKRIVGIWDVQMLGKEEGEEIYSVRMEFLIEKDSLIWKIEDELGNMQRRSDIYSPYSATPTKSGPKGMDYYIRNYRVYKDGDTVFSSRSLRIRDLTKNTFTGSWSHIIHDVQSPVSFKTIDLTSEAYILSARRVK